MNQTKQLYYKLMISHALKNEHPIFELGRIYEQLQCEDEQNLDIDVLTLKHEVLKKAEYSSL